MLPEGVTFSWLWSFCAVLVTFNIHHVLGKKSTEAPRPHIIMIVADDLGWDDVSFHGSPQIPTPHIDTLANKGVILNSYYVSPICTPTRGSLMTGKHPINLGIQHGTIFGTQPYGLPLGETTTPQYLKSLGYHTHGVGKWHLGFFEKEYTPTYRGFDSYYGFWNGKEDYWDHSSQEDVWGTDLRNNMQPVRNESGHYGTELFTEVAERIIHTHNKSKPLYLYLAQQGVHSANEREPLQAPQRLLDKFPYFVSEERRTYAAMVASLDESVGNITKALKRSGLYDNSVIVFTTDNGGAPVGFNWNQGSNYPLKGGKDTFWEGGVRGVGFVHSPLISKPGRVSYDLIDVTDWLPTFYHLAGGDVSKIQETIDGMNVWDTIAHGENSPRTEVLHNIDPILKFAAIRVKQYKLIINQDQVYRTTWYPRYNVTGREEDLLQPDTLPGAVIECAEWHEDKKAECDTEQFPCLFDVSKDPCEYRNLADTHMHVVRDLLLKLIHYQDNARPVWFPERDPSANPSEHHGYWGPWRSSAANKRILQKAVDAIPAAKEASSTIHGKSSARAGKSFSTHRSDDKEVYDMLHGILGAANDGKKGGIPGNQSSRAQKPLAGLFLKRKHKTEVDDLEDLQMFTKGAVYTLSSVEAKSARKEKGLADHNDKDRDPQRKSTSLGSKADGKMAEIRKRMEKVSIRHDQDKNALGNGLEGRRESKQSSVLAVNASKADHELRDDKAEAGTLDPNKQQEIEKDAEEPIQESADTLSIASGQGSGSEFNSGDDVSADDVSGGDDFDDEDGEDEEFADTKEEEVQIRK